MDRTCVDSELDICTIEEFQSMKINGDQILQVEPGHDDCYIVEVIRKDYI